MQSKLRFKSFVFNFWSAVHYCRRQFYSIICCRLTKLNNNAQK